MTQTSPRSDHSPQNTPFTHYVSAHTHLVYAAALRQLRDPAAADDATQAVFLVLLKKLPTLSPSRPIAPWLLQVTRYVCRDFQKKAARRRTHERRAAVPDRSLPDQPDEQRASALLDEALSRLPAHEREALTLRYLEQLDVPAVAAAAGIPLETARKRISRGLARLRDYFARRQIQFTTLGCGEFLQKSAQTHAPAHLATQLATLSPQTASNTAVLLAKSTAATMTFHLAALPTALTAAALLTATLTFAVATSTQAPPPPGTATPPATAPAPQWAHIRYDTGPIQDEWTNLTTGETCIAYASGDAMYLNDPQNLRQTFWKSAAVIDEDQPVRYAPGTSPPPWKSQSAWERYVAPNELAAAAARPANTPPSATQTPDTLHNLPVIRFDRYSFDSLGNRFLYSQLWADPKTHLPLQIKKHLQLADREQFGTDWSTGFFDFPPTGPADLYALGIPRDTPIEKIPDSPAATVKPYLDAIARARKRFLTDYSAVIWSTRDRSRPGDFESLQLLWRHGDLLRENLYFPPEKPLDGLAPDFLLKYAAATQPVQQQLMTTEREYNWTAAWAQHADKPQVHVTPHQNFPLLSQNDWPEAIQWPTINFAPDFQLLDTNDETPDNCIGLRLGGQGTTRADYYIDPHNDFICIKQISWIKPGDDWQKESETTLSKLHRTAGRIVAGIRTTHFYKNPLLHTSPSTLTTTILLAPQREFPRKLFDPTELTSGATVEGY